MTPKRPRGRPPIDDTDRSVSYTMRIPAKDLHSATTRAQDDRITLAEWIRRMLRHAADPRPK